VGVLPAFNTSYRSDAVSLTAVEKLRLAFRSSIDPVTFGVAFVVAGYHEALDQDPGFRWGIEGYGRRSGAAYLDTLNGTMIGNGFLPAILHQDPRYFRLGHGPFATGCSIPWPPMSSANTTTPASGSRTTPTCWATSLLAHSPTFTILPATPHRPDYQQRVDCDRRGAAGSIFEEFWPDVSRKYLHRDPTHGLDAQARAQDQAEKQAKQNQN